MTSDNKDKMPSKKNKDLNEIEIEQQDLLNVFFDKSSSQFESQFFLSRKRMLNAENGQTELSELLKSKLKALDMMLFILSNNKNILKESNLSCCEVLNNLLCISKKDKSYGEHIYSKIKSIILYILKNQLNLKGSNVDSNKVIVKFIITLLNIKFDNGYFKQILEIISRNKEISILFMNELFDKIFKGRNITIKLKEMKFILKTILLDDNINKFSDFFDIMEKILSFAHEKDSGGCRTSYQLNQVVFLLQYLIDILNIKEIKNTLPEKNELNKKLLNILTNFNKSINELVDKNDYQQDKTKLKKKELEALNEKIKRKKIFFSEMYNFLNKLKNYFQKELGNKENKELFQILEEINNLYKNTISLKYTIVINLNNKKDKKKNDKNKQKDNKDKKSVDKKIENNKQDNKEQNEEEIEEENNDYVEEDVKEDEKEDDKKNKNKNEEESEDDNNNDNDDENDNDDDYEYDNDEDNDDDYDVKNNNIELDEEYEENKINKEKKSNKNKKNKSAVKNKQQITKKKENKNEKKKESKSKKDTKKESKNKNKKHQ